MSDEMTYVTRSLLCLNFSGRVVFIRCDYRVSIVEIIGRRPIDHRIVVVVAVTALSFVILALQFYLLCYGVLNL